MTICKRGHVLTPENSRPRGKNGLKCLPCAAIRNLEYRRRQGGKSWDEHSAPWPERFWQNVDKDRPGSDCWWWTAGTNEHGYGQTHLPEGRHGWTVKAHRVSYELTVGPIPAGLQLDHLCRNRPCVNPAHLEPVTPQINTLRGMSPGARVRRTRRCMQGHPVAEKDGRSVCRVCRRVRDAAYRERVRLRRTQDAAQGEEQ